MIENAISIVMPVYFKESSEKNFTFLRRALESATMQNYASDYEILLVDDGSPLPINLASDFYGNAVDKVKIIRIESNLGLVNALNTGLKNAKYPLIARLDADDWWEPKKIEKQLACFRADPDLTLVAGGMTRYDEYEEKIDVHIRLGEWAEILNFFKEVGCPFPHGSILAKREIFEFIGFYPHSAKYQHCEDYALWGIWLRFFKAKIIEEPLLNYTVWNNSVSQKNTSQQQAASRIVNEEFSSNVDSNKLPMALNNLSNELNISLIEAGKLAYLIWHIGGQFHLPIEAVKYLESILPDRFFILSDESLTADDWHHPIELSNTPIERRNDEVTGYFYCV